VDHRSRIDAMPSGLHAEVLDGDVKLWLGVPAGRVVVVLGYAGEPFLRFDRRGVWLSEGSPTAVSQGLHGAGPQPAPAGAPPRWRLVSGDHAYAWHDHRLLPPGAVTSRTPIAWTVPMIVDGRRTAIRGDARYVSPPSRALWLVAGIVVVGVAAAGGLRGRRDLVEPAAAACAAVGLAAALASAVGTSLAGPRSTAGAVAEVAAAALVATAGAVVLARLQGRRRLLAAVVVGALVLFEGLALLGMFAHGAIVSALPDTLARALAALTIAGSSAALLLGAGALLGGPAPRRRVVVGARGRAA
jgi:hypothetical protein